MKLNWGEGASQGVQGAIQGAPGGPYAAAANGAFGFVKGIFSKKKKKNKPRSTLDKTQQRLYGSEEEGLYGEGPFSDLYNWDANAANDVFDRTTGRLALRNFNENIIPGITGQFRGRNLQNSSYTGEALSRAGRDVQENLDAERARMHFQGTEAAKARKLQSIQNIQSRNTQAIDRNGGYKSSLDSIFENLAGPAADYLQQRFGSSTSTPSAPSQPSGGRGGGYGYSMDIMNQFMGG